MPIEHALAALRDHWSDVAARLDEASLATLVALVGEYDDADADGRLDIALELVMDLGEMLPASHPVRRALAQGDMLTRGSATSDPAEVLGLFDNLFADLAECAGAASALDRAVRETEARLLESPAFTARELRDLGRDPADAALIRLPGPAGEQRLPAFQFDETGAPRPVVLRINALLGADLDPWGAASWWLDRDARLNEAPSRLIGNVPDDDLVAVAMAVVEAGE
ncbi:hypothetical protein [Actinomadura rubrisoli]|uniref:DUF2384 domain-containing protein n=1 Tax=Actinomadura rubrisoli TaxID=2530368 RepID=A0A4R5BBT8_9ACTN|nr:hypothetical protein [Actinomadura rubrisoli]TDD82639.1 hypothetical protein E1298_22495 [Actinomadura rubrisoli]